jgi:hypothetical protein
MRSILAILSAALLACAALPALAHHGWSEYVAEKVLTLDGVIEQSAYESPHTVIRLKTADKTWTAVLAPPFRMEARGLKAEAIKVGAKARVVGYPNRKHADELRAERIVVDGKTVELR